MRPLILGPLVLALPEDVATVSVVGSAENALVMLAPKFPGKHARNDIREDIMVKYILSVLAIGSTAAQADTLSSDQVIDRVMQAAVERSDAMRHVIGELRRAPEHGLLDHLHARWLEELTARGIGTALEVAVLEAQLIAEHAEERDAYMAPFLAWDKDGDGIIDRDEAAIVLAADDRYGYDLEQFDINRDQQITQDEILRVTRRRQGPFELDDMAAMLVFDLNGDGLVTAAEIGVVADALSEIPPPD